MQTYRTALLLLAACAPLMAQPAPHTTTSPAVFAGHFAPSANLAPHARSGGMIQFWQRGDNFTPSQVILAVGVRPQNPVGATMTQSMEIVFDNATVGFSGLSPTFATNFSSAQTVVFARRNISLAPVITPDANVPIVWMPLDVPWLFAGPHFLAQFDYGTAVSAVNTVHQSDAYLMNLAHDTQHTQSSPSCGGTLTASYDTSSTSYRLGLVNALANGFVLHMISANNRRFAGAVPLPLLLDSVGMVGCYLGLDPLVYIPSVADGTGSDNQFVPFTVPTTNTAILYAQTLHASAGPLGIATSNLANSLMGGVGLTNYLYNWTLDGPTAQYGPYATNRGPVLLFQP
jgi:hypothetical protein